MPKAISMELEIRVELGAFPVEQECVVPRQLLCPQLPFVVGCVLFVVKYLFVFKKRQIFSSIDEINSDKNNLYPLDNYKT